MTSMTTGGRAPHVGRCCSALELVPVEDSGRCFFTFFIGHGIHAPPHASSLARMDPGRFALHLY